MPRKKTGTKIELSNTGDQDKDMFSNFMSMWEAHNKLGTTDEALFRILVLNLIVNTKIEQHLRGELYRPNTDKPFYVV